MLDLVNSYIENELSPNKMRENNVIVRGSANISKDKEKLLVGEYIPRVEWKVL